MNMSMRRIGLVSLLLSAMVQAVIASCPTSSPPPCQNPIMEGWGCGSFGTTCCHYVDYRCPGSSTIYRVWDSHPYWGCQRDLHGEYTCLAEPL